MLKETKIAFQNILKNKSKLYFIHYSCQSLSDANEGYSPRISSIAVLHYESSQMSSFSMHLSAEELHMQRTDIADKYNEIEIDMLGKFALFVQEHYENSCWMHWNMNNINFGFETLIHRYKILSGNNMAVIPITNRVSISDLLKKRYGENYVKDPKMLNLMELNGSKDRKFLTGEEEATAFKANEFVKLHNSTMCKVYFFRDVFNKTCNNTLNTRTNRFRYILNNLYQHPIIQILGILGILGSIIQPLIKFIKKATG